jgi:putative FmdB family regulatory protein
MPTYQFRCPNGTIVERSFKISEVPDAIPCPEGEGGGSAVRIISGGAGLIFKGSGFYITDYGKDGKKDQREASKKPEGGGAGAAAAGEKAGKPADSGASAPASTPSSGGSSSGSTSGSSSGGSES